ncbi:hypothetical protein C2857_003396 [Epichloe festucae Fl1]|uniref:Zn(2)-C6 fungal-type domain-containing protein n=1 Tax=Epichloe festucae (strain Fl1) TaxID=877507 RepID=A0A7S9KS33_EPIFF|nr:hypothetical protein C2857_003396 [Epichloe festucae Fl1]
MNTHAGVAKLDDKASAASRQKSCNACVRGKRRCDKRKPRCTRCSAKGLDCVYQKLPPRASTSHGTSTSSSGESARPSLVSSMSGPWPLSASASDVPDFDMSFDMESLGTGTTAADTSPESLQPDIGVPLGCGTHGSSGLDFSIVDFMAQATGPDDDDIWNLHPFATETTDKLNIPALPTALAADSAAAAAAMVSPSMHQQLLPHQQLQPIRDLSLIENCERNCLNFDPLTVHDPNTCVGYVVNFLTTMHRTFAQTRALPFMHSRLWTGQLPKTILAVFSASAAYAASTPSNKGWTVRLLIDAGREIHSEGERAVSHADKLSRVQALLILNSMRIFDGDLGLRAAAEREFAVMLDWLKDLKKVQDDIELEEARRGGSNGGLVRQKMPPKSWENMAFTASRHLWDANSSVNFFRAWREKPQFTITGLNFKEFWIYARPDDCDDFTRLLLTSQVEVDTVDHFMNGDVSIPVNPGRVP